MCNHAGVVVLLCGSSLSSSSSFHVGITVIVCSPVESEVRALPKQRDSIHLMTVIAMVIVPGEAIITFDLTVLVWVGTTQRGHDCGFLSLQVGFHGVGESLKVAGQSQAVILDADVDADI
jgi:hypothetical protein